jgi:hypothetical protein
VDISTKVRTRTPTSRKFSSQRSFYRAMGEVVSLAERRAQRAARRPRRGEPVRAEFLFDLACPFTYLAAERVERTFAAVRWTPASATALRCGSVASGEGELERLRAAAEAGHPTATDLADWLVRQRVPFAEAHEIAGAAVRYCESHGLELSELSSAQLEEISPKLSPNVLPALTVAGSLASRDGRGGTAPDQVRRQLDEVRDSIDAIRGWVGELEDGRGLRGSAAG